MLPLILLVFKVLSGMMTLTYPPYDAGDFIEAGGLMGKVYQKSLVSTTAMTPDNQSRLGPSRLPSPEGEARGEGDMTPTGVCLLRERKRS